MTDENERKIDDCCNELTNIKSWIDKNPLDSNVRYLAAYAVVKASGTIEVVFKSMIYDVLADKVKLETQNYLTKMVIESSCNPSTGNMSNLLDQLDTQRKIKFNNMIKGKTEKSDLNSLVSLRNDVAHGRTMNSSINTVKKYFESGVFILEKLEESLN